jgi:hypothetical protein
MSTALTKRGQEMRAARLAMEYARAHDCSIIEAKRRMAAKRKREADIFRARLRQCGTDARSSAKYQQKKSRPAHADQNDERWMMRD